MSAYFKVFSTIAKKLKGNKSKVGPTIKSVKPNLKKTVAQTKSDEYHKRIKSLDSAEKKIKTGREMMREGQKERKKMVDTGRAFQFQNIKSYHPMKPGDKDKYKANMKVAGPQKKFKTGKELEREKKMGGGMMGRRFGYKGGKLVGKQSIIAKQAGDPKKIESVDFKVLQAKRKNKKKVV